MLANPNWLVVVSAFFAICGIGFMAKAMIADPVAVPDERSHRRMREQRNSDTGFGMALLFVGFCMHVAAQFASLPFGAWAVLALLALAMSMLIYMALDGLFGAALMPETRSSVYKPTRVPMFAAANGEVRGSQIPLVLDAGRP